MSLYSYYRISKPSKWKVSKQQVQPVYRRLRNRTFLGVTVAYSLFYVCRLAFNVMKQPLVDEGIFTAGQLGIIGSVLLFTYAFGKFLNGFIADYCNIKRFMATGLFVSALINFLMGALGLLHGWLGMGSLVLLILFSILWGLNGWFQSMGSPPGIISLSRWFPLAKRGTYYSIFSATPYIGKAILYSVLSLVVGWIGWQYGFVFASFGGLVGAMVIVLFVSDTPESKGLPSIQKISGEAVRQTDKMPTRELQKMVVRHPGIWVIAVSSIFVYIAQYGISNWGTLFLQKAKGFSIESAGSIIGLSEAAGVAGTVLAGWLSDTVFKGNRIRPVLISGFICLGALAVFLFGEGGYLANLAYLAVFSLSIAVLYCIVAGLMALDIVPRKATGAALGIVGLSSYTFAAFQDLVSGFLIQGHTVSASGAPIAEATYNFAPVSFFWLAACFLAFLVPVCSWRLLKK